MDLNISLLFQEMPGSISSHFLEKSPILTKTNSKSCCTDSLSGRENDVLEKNAIKRLAKCNIKDHHHQKSDKKSKSGRSLIPVQLGLRDYLLNNDEKHCTGSKCKCIGEKGAYNKDCHCPCNCCKGFYNR